jgi:tetratricopeptide (TPR) repeat protein
VTAVYLNSLQLGLALDAAALAEDKRIQAFTAENLMRILREPYWPPEFLLGLYRPLTTFSFLFNYSIAGSGASGASWHALNLLLHLGNAALVFALTRRLFASVRTAWFAAALWAIHPLGTDSVTNIGGRADLLAAAAVLGGLYWYIRRAADAETPPLKTAAVLLAIALGGMWSKENAAVLPGLMLLWDMTYGDGLRDWKRRAPAYAAAVLAPIIFFATRPAMPSMVVPVVDNVEISADFVTARLTALKVILQYLGQLVFPLRLSSDYAYNQVPLARLGDPASWIAPIAIVALLAAVIVRRRRDPLLFLAAGWFGIALLPVSNLVIIIGAVKAERFLYLPAIGFAIAAAALLERLLAGRLHWEREATVAGAVLLAVFGVRAAARNPDWRDTATIWASNLEAAPMDYKVHKNIASSLNFRDPSGTIDEVGRHLEIACKIVSDLPLVDTPHNVLLDMGLNLRLKAERAGGMNSEAGRAFFARSLEYLEKSRQAARLRRARDGSWTDFPHLYINLGLVYEHFGRLDDALAAYREGRRFDVRNAYLYDAVSRILSNRGDAQGALRNVLEQWLAGAGDAGTVERLRILYSLTPGGECAFGPNGMNPACPKVRADMCAAGAATVRVFSDARLPAEAARIRTTLASTYGCRE